MSLPKDSSESTGDTDGLKHPDHWTVPDARLLVNIWGELLLICYIWWLGGGMIVPVNCRREVNGTEVEVQWWLTTIMWEGPTDDFRTLLLPIEQRVLRFVNLPWAHFTEDIKKAPTAKSVCIHVCTGMYQTCLSPVCLPCLPVCLPVLSVMGCVCVFALCNHTVP